MPAVPDSPHCRAAQHRFFQQFSSTRRGARLARLLAAGCLDEWGHPYDGEVSRAVTLLIAELAANAVLHCPAPGRDFHLLLLADSRWIRVEISDVCVERRPRLEPPAVPEAESGRGLVLIDAFAARWGSVRRAPVGKTVWAEYPVADPVEKVVSHPPADS